MILCTQKMCYLRHMFKQLSITLALFLALTLAASATDITVVSGQTQPIARGISNTLLSPVDRATGGVFLHFPNAINPQFSMGPGALFGVVPFNLALGLEVDFLYSPRVFNWNNIPYSQKRAKIPVLTRATVGRIISFGMGAYYTRLVDDAKGLGDAEFGFTTGLRIQFFSLSFVGLAIEPRYSFALSNVGTEANPVRFSEFELFAGLRFGETW